MRINRLILVGFFLVLAGAVLPFLILMGVLESTFFWNFLAFVTSVVGVFLGILGSAMYVGQKRREDDWR
ncbi:MAG: hypothetical protein H6659_17875 [Ardenticatenaceae bacterium]|nr:hypothetical protein [Ardenticatenaceae bacterium]